MRHVGKRPNVTRVSACNNDSPQLFQRIDCAKATELWLWNAFDSGGGAGRILHYYHHRMQQHNECNIYNKITTTAAAADNN